MYKDDPSKEHVQSNSEDKKPDIIDKLAELNAEIDGLVDQKVDRDREILQLLAGLNEQQRKVLQLKYIEGCRFEIIAIVMAISYRWVEKCFYAGISEFQKKIIGKYLTSRTNLVK